MYYTLEEENEESRIESAFISASINGDLPKLQSILADHPEVSLECRDNFWCMTSLHCASGRGHLKIVAYLAEIGAKINSKDNDGNSPLISSVHNGHHDVVKFLLEKSADVNATNDSGNSSLHFACKMGDLEMIRLLIAAGGNMYQTNKEKINPFDMARSNSQLKAVQLLSSREIFEARDSKNPVKILMFYQDWTNCKYLL